MSNGTIDVVPCTFFYFVSSLFYFKLNRLSKIKMFCISNANNIVE